MLPAPASNLPLTGAAAFSMTLSGWSIVIVVTRYLQQLPPHVALHVLRCLAGR